MQTRPLRPALRMRRSEVFSQKPLFFRKPSLANSEQSCHTTTTARSAHTPRRNYRTIRDSFLTILRTEPDGLKALYNGILIDTCSTLLSSFIYFYVYTSLRKISALAKRYKHQSKSGMAASSLGAMEGVLEELLIGAVSGMMSKLLTCPLSNITVRLQTSRPSPRPTPMSVINTPMSECVPSRAGSGSDSGSDSDSEDEAGDRPRGLLAIIKAIQHERGWLGFWCGYSNNCILTLNPSVTFYLMKLFQNRRPTLAGTFLGSALASSCATILTYPLMLSKTLVQTRGGRESAYAILRQRLEAAGGDWKAALFMGLSGQLAKGFIGQGVTMTVKVQLERLMILVYAKMRMRQSVKR